MQAPELDSMLDDNVLPLAYFTLRYAVSAKVPKVTAARNRSLVNNLFKCVFIPESWTI